jgi:cytochrome c551/c552
MPATEKTWRDQMRMHVVFGVSALIMLVATVWMLAADHSREWRATELANRDKESWTAAAMLKQQSAVSQSTHEKLAQELAAAKSAHVEPAPIEKFKSRVHAEDDRLAKDSELAKQIGNVGPADTTPIDAATAALNGETEGTPEAAKARDRLKSALDNIVREARRREDTLTTRRKFTAAEQTATVSARGIAIGGGAPRKEIEARIDELGDKIAALDVAVTASKTYRQDLEAIVRQITAGEDDLAKQVDAIETSFKRLEENLATNTGGVGDWVNRWPVLDALYNGNIKLDQVWLPDMKINYNFSEVSRYDRCVNCHRAIDQTAPGSATQPAYPAIPPENRVRTIDLATPDAPVIDEALEAQESPKASLAALYGFTLAPHGQIDPYAVTIETVLPDSLAAKAGLEMGDVLEKINGGQILTKANVEGYLLEPEWGMPIQLTIRRGLPQPYTSHPRLDLFVGGSSPHKKGEMGCTICHDGQGSATDFKWASHTPNDPDQAIEWTRKYEWIDNHHWIFPMTPERFIESNCLKCHHEVVELEPSERFPDPPAPKLVAGYETVRMYGCYGCHEMNGFDGPNKRIGPDLRIEPNYYDVATQVLQDPGLSDDQRGWAETLVHSSDNDSVRHLLFRSINEDADAPADEAKLKPATHALADGLKDVETPGQLRKVGPSLRHLDSKVDYAWLYSWIKQPTDFRPTTRMPQFFGNFQHLKSHLKEFTATGPDGNPVEVTDKDYTQRFEDIEVRALTQFLLADSQPFEYLDPPAGITEAPSAERGHWLFESRGCLACHSHEDFPGIHSTQGPDLSRVAAKFNTGKGQRWLYSWIRQPNRYHTRTVMPNLFLDPIAAVDAAGNPTGQVSDPAADIAAFLLSVPTDWRPNAPAGPELTADEERALEDLTAVWLSASFPKRLAATYAREGIPDRLAGSVKIDERGLLEQNMTAANRTQQQLDYVARRSLSRYGCFGCHDIPGFENAKPIGTPLANWGRKDVSQLAFENIGVFLSSHGLEEHSTSAAPAEHGSEEGGDEAAGGSHAHGLDPLNYDPDTGYFLQSLNSHQRNGFLWQKLRMPRSFDYATTKTKRYDERLRMPKFPFTAEQREQVMTFVLGLTSEPPASKYIYQPGPREEAIVQGRHVIDKYNCKGCHVLDMERWKFAFAPDLFEEPPEVTDFPFVDPTATPAELADSLAMDRRGMLQADIHGLATRNEETGDPNLVDIDGVPIDPDDTESEPYYEFSLYQPAVVSGALRLVGVQNLLIPAQPGSFGPTNGTAYPTSGGDLAKYLFSRVIAEEHKTNPAAKGSEAWGWLPPPLHNEGSKVQTDWLHDFLMDPTQIRPAVVLRMPNFNMSSREASALVNYFAAKNEAEFPYEYNQRRRGDYLAKLEQSHPGIMNDAMKIVTDGNYCVKCHAVGDFQPIGAIRTFGPSLSEVYRRLRPDYVRRWIGNPVRILPYTGMPVNIPYDPHAPNLGGVSQSLFPGTSIQQLDGLVDLLMNFDEYAERQTSVRSLVKEPPAATANPSGAMLPTSGQPARR